MKKLVQVFDDQDNLVHETEVNEDGTFVETFTLPPGSFSIKLIEEDDSDPVD